MENKSEVSHLTDCAIFTRIWTSPRIVFKFINESSYNKFITVLLILGGITSTLNNASNKNMGDKMPLISVLIVCLIGGVIFGWLSFYMYAALLSWTGKWLKGKGNTKSLLRMISYALIPSLVVLLLVIIRVVILGNAEFQSNVDILDKGIITTIIYFFSAFIEIVIVIWTLVLIVIGISEVQELSIWKSILNMILPGILLLVVLLPIAALAFIVGDFIK